MVPTKLRNIYLMRHLAGRVKKILTSNSLKDYSPQLKLFTTILKATVVNNKSLHLFLIILWKA